MKKYVMLELYRSSEGNEETIQELKSLMNLIIWFCGNFLFFSWKSIRGI